MPSFHRFYTLVALVSFFLITTQISASTQEQSQNQGQSYVSELLMDINQQKMDFNADKTVFFKNAIYASGMDNSYRYSLWKSDGSEAGSSFLAEVWVNRFIPTEGFLFFTTALDGQLWRTDGTAAGTIMLQYSSAGTGMDPQPPISDFRVIGNTLFFRMKDHNENSGLWKSDGTIEGTRLIKDLERKHEANFGLATFNNQLFFIYSQNDQGFGLWKTDGSQANTSLVTFIGNPLGLHPIALNNMLLFGATQGTQRGLWKSDGTSSGTVFVGPFSGDESHQGIAMLASTNSYSYFSVRYPSRLELWRSDGTIENTIRLKSFAIPNQKLLSISNFHVTQDKFFFHSFESDTGWEWWVSDGTVTGTHILKNIQPDDSFDSPNKNVAFGASIVDNELFFIANQGSELGKQIWKSDGSVTGTVPVSSFPTSFKLFGGLSAGNNMLYFLADDGIHGRELWKYSLANSNAELIIDINRSNDSSYPTPLYSSSKWLFFSTIGDRLWATDGSLAATNPISNQEDMAIWYASNFNIFQDDVFFIARHTDESLAIWRFNQSTGKGSVLRDASIDLRLKAPTFLRVAGDHLFFNGSNGSNDSSGQELWISDGTIENTKRVKDIWEGPESSDPQQALRKGSDLVFVADDGISGRELWLSDGTEQGTRLVKDIAPGKASSDIKILHASHDLVFFVATDSNNRYKLWRSDGTSDGTFAISGTNTNDIRSISDGSSLIGLDGVLYFERGYQSLWRSDGTEEGTYEFAKLATHRLSKSARIGNTIYFLAKDATSELQFWKSDGTPEGTQKLIQGPTKLDHLPNFYTIFTLNQAGDTLFFVQEDNLGVPTLWKVQNASPAPIAIKKLPSYPGRLEHAFDDFILVNQDIFFTTPNPTNPITRQLWKSDGSEQGTVVVESSLSTAKNTDQRLFRIGDSLIYTGMTAETGSELWITKPAPNAPIDPTYHVLLPVIKASE